MKHTACLMLLATLVISEPARPGTPNQNLQWTVINRFTLFERADIKDTELRARKSAQLFSKYSLPPSTLPSAAYTEAGTWKKGSPFRDGELPVRSTWWDESRGSYKTEFYDPPKHVVLRLRVTSFDAYQCVWKVGVKRRTMLCKEAYEDVFENNPTIPVVVTADRKEVVNGAIRIGHRIFIGIGDSYASGEGNPDVPTVWKAYPSGQSRYSKFGWPRYTVERSAQWLNGPCHRSFWSWQMQTILWIASNDPHSVVTFGFYACSGAEIWNGLLARQKAPPGSKKGCEESKRQNRDTQSGNCFVQHAQLSAIVHDLCDRSSIQQSYRNDLPEEPYIQIRKHVKELPKVRCASPINKERKVEAILLSIGGNDIGFGGVIRWAMTPPKTYRKLPLKIVWDQVWKRIIASGESKSVCPSMQEYREQDKYGPCTTPSSINRINGFLVKEGYTLLANDLGEIFAPNPPTIYIPQYMDPLLESDGKTLCTTSGTKTKELRENNPPNRQSAWDGMFSIITEEARGPKALATQKVDIWGINLVFEDSKRVRSNVVLPLQETQNKIQQSLPWKLVTDQVETFSHHGWCAVKKDADRLDFFYPAWEGAWKSNRLILTNWHAYALRERWFRTSSDSLLTQYVPYEDGIGGSFNGTFHPTAQGHAHIADAVINAMQK